MSWEELEIEVLVKNIKQLILCTVSSLTQDVYDQLEKANQNETKSASLFAIETILANAHQAKHGEKPLCQDTGTLDFYIKIRSFEYRELIEQTICTAVDEATCEGILRPNAVDPLTNQNLNKNIPNLHFEKWENEEIEICLLLKGGGCENRSEQYSLPVELEGVGVAHRDIEGVKKSILNAIYRAQGLGCSAGFIGVGIGGDRSSGYALAKKQLLKNMSEAYASPLEKEIVHQANQLNIGTMGFGGTQTLLGCRIETLPRIPASFYVTVSYNCWALRRQGVHISLNTGKILEWMYPVMKPKNQLRRVTHKKPKYLTFPCTKEEILQLRAGELVYLTGEISTGRDQVHRHLINEPSPISLRNKAIYHSGPVVVQSKKGWQIQSAGPTTSMRQEAFQSELIKKLGLAMVIGKGGMGERTRLALQENQAVYASAIGGSGAYYAKCVEKIQGVDFIQEFGVTEAMWHFKITNFPVIITMDAYGFSCHKKVKEDSFCIFQTMYKIE